MASFCIAQLLQEFDCNFAEHQDSPLYQTAFPIHVDINWIRL